MAWSAAFLAALEARAASPIYRLQVVRVNDEPGGSWAISSSRNSTFSARIAADGVRQDGARVTPRSWSTTVGATSVDVVGDLTSFHTYVTRGTVLELSMGFAGWSEADFQVIAVGPYRSCRGQMGPRWTIEILDLFASFTQRWRLDSSANELFYGMGGSTTISTAYVAGAATLEVASTSQSAKETGEPGAILVTPSTGDPFVLTYAATATGPVRFTGCSAAGQMGTTAVDAAIGDSVTFLAYLHGHPLNIVRGVMVSRGGTGANSSLDTLPQAWGLGIATEFVDHPDIRAWRDAVVVSSTGSYYWQIAASEPQDDAYSWITGTWAQAGMWPVMRQGKISWRAAQNTQAPRLHTGFHITDADVAEVISYEDYDSELSAEYGAVSVYSAEGNGTIRTETPATIPLVNEGLLYTAEGLWDAWADVVTDDLDRLAEAGLRIPELLELQLVTMRAAQLVNGDLVTLEISRPGSRRYGSRGFVGQVAMVLSVSPDWSRWGVRLALAVYPATGDQFA